MGFLYSQLFITPPYPSNSFSGQTIIVTGSNVGLGKEAARHFARLGASKVIIAVRNTKAGEAAKEDIVSSTKCNASNIEVWELDLGSQKSVKAFADRAEKELPRIDVLLENAGLATDKFELVEGHERTVTVNVINTFYLAFLLLPRLKQSAKQFKINPRLVIVSSEVHGWAKFPERSEPNIFQALSDEKKAKANMGERYPLSKLLEVLVIRQIAPKLKGSGVTLNMLNPGLCHSELGRDSGLMLTILKFFLARTTEVGSRTLVASACAGKDSHGQYMSDAVVDDAAVVPWVKAEEGDKVGKQVWNELKTILESRDKGVTDSVSA